MLLLPKTDLNCISFAMNLNTVLGLMPKYRFEKRSISLKNRLYCFIWVLMHLFCVMYHLDIVVSYLGTPEISNVRFTETFLRVLDILGFSVSPAIGVITIYFTKSITWRHFFQNINAVVVFFKKSQLKTRHNIVTQFYLIICIGNVVLLIRVALTLGSINPMDVDFLEVAYLWEIYNVYLFNGFMTLIAMFLLASYKNLNALLYVACSPYGHHGSIKEIKKVLKVLYDTSQYFNAIFGSHLLGVTVYIIIDLLAIVDLLMIHFLSPDDGKLRLHVSEEFFFFFLLLLTYGFIVFSCDLAMKECHKFTEICYRIQGTLERHSPLRQEILILAHTSHAFTPQFSANGFIELNRRTLLTILNSVLVYLVVIINFNMGSI